MFKRVPSAGTKAESDMLPIAPTSSPACSNTFPTFTFSQN